jgi:diphthine-ammonia ligase
MCGIIGVFGHKKAKEQVQQGLAQMENRGVDARGYGKVGSGWFGHNLHAIVNLVPQPLKNQGMLIANCEVYNWQELANKHNLVVKNDAELILHLLDKSGFDAVEEFDGVFAFVYYRGGKVFLARDILGIKPIWFALEEDTFAFCSEKKVLMNLGYQNIQEMNPRSFMLYDTKNNTLTTQKRPFYTYLPEHVSNLEKLQKETTELLHQAISKRVPQKKFGLLFSGGVDSTYLAHYFKQHGCEFTCYTAALDSEFKEPADVVSAKKVAEDLGLNLKIKKIKQSDIPKYLKKLVPLIEDSNVVKVGVALTFYVACEMAKEDGCKVIFSGLGSEELFAGYERHKKSSNINRECVSGLLKMYERDLYRDDVLTMENQLELRVPFLDSKLVKYALKIPEKYKITEGFAKWIFRQIALTEGIPHEHALRKKKAAQYGSRFDHALGKLAKEEGKSKSSYLHQFLPHPIMKLGVLFSSGKDSAYAAYLMQRQNYELTCLLTVLSKNPESYMFHTPAIEMASLQADAMHIPLITRHTDGEKEKELYDLQQLLKQGKREHKIEGIICGAVFSAYQRERIEMVCDALGLKIFSPLWHKSQEKLLRELVANKFTVIFSAVAGDGLHEGWLGRTLDEKAIQELVQLKQKFGVHEAGEGGEFESLVLDCPLFKRKLKIVEMSKHMDTSCSGRLTIEEARLVTK